MPVLRVIVVVALAIASAAAYDATLSPQTLTFDEAAAHCRSLGRRLPVIETEEQMHLVEQRCSQLGKTADCTWIALRCSTGVACGAANGWHTDVGATGLRDEGQGERTLVRGGMEARASRTQQAIDRRTCASLLALWHKLPWQHTDGGWMDRYF